MLRGDPGLDLLDHAGPGGFVLLGGLHRVEALLAQLLVGEEVDRATEHDVGTTTGHVGGHGDGALVAGERHDLGLVRVCLGVQHAVRDAALAQQLGEVLGLLDRDRADEDGLALAVALGDVVGDGVVLRLLGPVDEVGLVDALHRLVGRDRDHAELVDLVELRGLGHGRTGHAGELLVEAEVVLQGDGREGLVLLADGHALLGLDRLVQAVVVATPREHAAGVLVDDEHLAVHDDVLLVVAEQLLGLDGVVEERDERGVGRLVEVLDAEVVLDLGDARLEHRDRALLLVDLVVDVLDQRARDRRELAVPADLVLGRAADDQRGACLVDQDRVDLVDDGEVVAALDALLDRARHVVAQVVEAELVVGAVGDVAVVRRAPLVGAHLRQDHPHLETEVVVDAAHHLGLVLRQVVVDRDDVDALAGQRVEVRRQGGDQGLALTGLHLGDVAEVQGGGTHDLDVEGAHARDALGSLTDGGERLRHQVVEGLAVLQALPELRGHPLELGVGHRDEVVLDGIDGLRDGLELAQDLPLADAEDLVKNGRHDGVTPDQLSAAPLYPAHRADPNRTSTGISRESPLTPISFRRSLGLT